MHKRIKNLLVIFMLLGLYLANSLTVVAMSFGFDEVSKSVFVVAASDGYSDALSMGSGFAIDDSHVITNAHVVAGGAVFAIGNYSETAEDNIENFYEAQLVSIDETIDIAILKVKGLSLTPLKMADARTIKEGDNAYAIGTPEGLANTLTTGTVSSKLRVHNGVNYVQSDVGITHGSSGGPLLNEYGEVIGMNTFGLATSESIRFAIRVDVIEKYISEHLPNASISGSVTASQTESMSENTTNIESVSEPESVISDKNVTSSDNKSQSDDTSYSYVVVPVGAIVSLIAAVVGAISRTFRRQKSSDDIVVIPRRDSGVPVSMPPKESTPQNKIKQEKAFPVTTGIKVLNGSLAEAQVELADGQTVNLGKDPKLANLVFDKSYQRVSRIHCTVSYSETFDKYFVTDCSSNGTYFENGIRFAKNARTSVARGSVLKLADDGCRIKLL